MNVLCYIVIFIGGKPNHLKEADLWGSIVGVARSSDFELFCSDFEQFCSDFEQFCSDFEQFCSDFEQFCSGFEQFCIFF